MQSKRLAPTRGLTTASIALSMLLLGVACVSRNPVTETSDLDSLETGFTEEGLPYIGSSEAPIQFVEYSDYFCPHCRDFVLNTHPMILVDYVASGKIRYVLNYFALAQPQVFLVSASRCAGDQEMFWSYHTELFENQDRFASVQSVEDLRTLLMELGTELEMDMPEFEECWEMNKHLAMIVEQIQSAYEFGIESTPTLFVQDQRIEGAIPYDSLKPIIDAELAKLDQ